MNDNQKNIRQSSAEIAAELKKRDEEALRLQLVLTNAIGQSFSGLLLGGAFPHSNESNR